MNAVKYYQYCSVPFCENNNKKTPEKLFIIVPQHKNIRKKWLALARRDWKSQSMKSTIYFCQDHFDLPNDMDNYMQYKVQGYIKKIRMKKGCLPSRFTCQRKTAMPSTDNVIIKEQRKILVEEAKVKANETFEPGKDSGVKAANAPARELREKINCNQCGGNIIGFRYTCLQCVDYDLCAACEACEAHAAHYVLRIPAGRPHMEIAKLLRMIRSELEGKVRLAEPKTESTNPKDESVEIEIKKEVDPEPDPLQCIAVDIEIEPLEYKQESVVQSSSTSNILQKAISNAETSTPSAVIVRELIKTAKKRLAQQRAKNGERKKKTAKKRPAPQMAVKAEPKKAKESPILPNRKLVEVRSFPGPGSSVSSPVVAQGTRSPDSGGGFVRTRNKPLESGK